MSIDVATLVFEFKSDSAGQAERAMDRLIAKGDQLDATSRKVRKATDFASDGQKTATGIIDQAARSATNLAAAEGAVEKATRSAGRASAEVRAARQLEASAMRELVAATKAYERDQAAAAKATALAAREQAQAVASLEARVFALKSAIDPTFAAQSRLDAEMKEATALYKMGAISASDYAKAVGQLDARMAATARGHGDLVDAQGRATASSRHLTLAGLNLSRQFTDIGVQIAGQTPLYLVLIQQLPQIADAFAVARLQGLGFGAVLKGVAGQVAAVAGMLAPLLILVAAAAAGFALLNRELSKDDPKNFAKTLNLTDEQLKRVKNTTITVGDTFKATIDVMAKYLTSGPLGAALKWFEEKWNALMDWTANFAFEATARVMGVFIGAYRTIVANWQNFPAVLGDLFAMAANAALDATERLVNGQVASLNTALAGMRLLNPNLAWVPDIPEADLSRFKMKVSGAAKFVGTAFVENIKVATDDVRGGMRKIGDEIAAGRKKNATDRILKEAGDAAKAAKERESQAQKDAKSTAEYIRGLEDEIAKIGLTEIALGRLAAAREIERALKYGDTKSAERIHQLVLEKEALQALADGLKEAAEARAEFLKANTMPVVFENTPAKLATDAGKIDSTGNDKLAEMNAELEKGVQRWRDVEDGADQFYYSLRNNDWLGATMGLVRAIQGIKAAFDAAAISGGKMAGYLTAGGTIASAAGPIVGGKAGSVLTGVGSGIATGAAIGSVVPVIGTAIGGLVGGILGGLGGLFGGGSGKKKAAREAAERAAAAEQDRLQRVADEHRAFEIRMMELQGKSAEALAARRADELAKMDESNRAIQQQVYALEDQAEAATKAAEAASAAAAIAGERRGIEIRLMEAMGNASGALAARRADEIAALDESNRALLGLVFAAEDAATTLATLHSATETAEGILRSAYDDFAAAKRQEIEGLRQAAAGLKAFRQELNIGAIAGRDPTSQLAATRREFERLSALDASNPERLANLQSVSQAFLEASKAASPTQLAFNRDLQAVRRATEASEMAATAQADAAQLQLDAQTAAVGQLITLNSTAISIQAAIAAVLAARANETAAGGAANDNTLDVARYLALNPDLAANWNAGGSLRTAGGTLEAAARAHYATTGRGEIAAGLRTYAAGGMHSGGLRLVGEEGPELEATGPARIYSARETQRMMGGDSSELIAEVRALREEVAALRAPTERTASAAKSMDDRGRKQEVLGIYVRGETPGDPVITDEAA